MRIEKEIAEMLVDILDDNYDSIQYMDRDETSEQKAYDQYFKCKSWVEENKDKENKILN